MVLAGPWQAAERALPPVVKWPGSKRSLAPSLGRLFPRWADRYLEPFLGGGALLPFRPARAALAGDVVPELVELWRLVRDRPRETADAYAARWERLRREGPPAFYAIRDSFNQDRSPEDLLFLSRTCVNGLARFNRAGEFNNSLHLTRAGIRPDRLRAVLERWSERLRGVEFLAGDYRETLARAKKGDFVFLDPPYAGTRGRYHPGRLDAAALYAELERLNRLEVQWVLTLDGAAGARTYDAGVPGHLWRTRLALASGNSPFTKLMRTGLDQVVEAVYANYEPPAAVLAALPQVLLFG